MSDSGMTSVRAMADSDQQQNPADEVRLSVPATPEFLRLARVTATGLASRIGFSFDDVEDLRLAIDELCFALMGNRGREATMHLSYRVLDGALEIEGVLEPSGEGHLSEWSDQILDALVDEHEVGVATDGWRIRVLKRHAG